MFKKRNPLKTYFDQGKSRLIYKWDHYFDIYDQHFRKFRRKPVTVVEFGVFHGGSLQMWKHYFGRRARIIGVDIEPRCKELEEKQIQIYIGDQSDRTFLRKLADEIGPIDIVIDDGGHIMKQQLTSFKELWPHVKDGGLYVVEDLHTNYWKAWGGGYLRSGTFITFAKGLIDRMHARYAAKADRHRLRVDSYTKSVRGMYIYDSVIVLEKDDVKAHRDVQSGRATDIKFSHLRPKSLEKRKSA